MTVLLSLSSALRLGLLMLLIGFTAGLVAGYRASGDSGAELPADQRAFGAVHCLDRSGPPCTPTSFSS